MPKFSHCDGNSAYQTVHMVSMDGKWAKSIISCCCCWYCCKILALWSHIQLWQDRFNCVYLLCLATRRTVHRKPLSLICKLLVYTFSLIRLWVLTHYSSFALHFRNRNSLSLVASINWIYVAISTLCYWAKENKPCQKDNSAMIWPENDSRQFNTNGGQDHTNCSHIFFHCANFFWNANHKQKQINTEPKSCNFKMAELIYILFYFLFLHYSLLFVRSFAFTIEKLQFVM